MTADVALVLGALFLLLMLSPAVSDFAAEHPPRRLAMLFTIGGALVMFALTTSRAVYQTGRSAQSGGAGHRPDHSLAVGVIPRPDRATGF